MKKKILLFVTLLSCLFSTTFFAFNNKQNYTVTAEDIPSYFSVTSSNNEKVLNGGSLKITNAQFVTIELKSSDKILSSISPQIKLNNTDLALEDINNMIVSSEDYKIDINTETSSEEFIFKIDGKKIFENKRNDGTNLYGKFEIDIDYFEGLNHEIKNINYTFYLLRYDNYNIPEIKNVSFSDNVIGYNKVYEYYYNKAQLPYTLIDGKFFDIEISKKVGNSDTELMQVQMRKNNGDYDIIITNALSDVFVSRAEDELIKIVFNGLAEYEITYKAILQVTESEIVELKDATQNNINFVDQLKFLGFNLFHSDSSNPLNKNEFVELNSNGTILQGADCTYLFENLKEKQGYDIEQELISKTLKLENIVTNIVSTNQSPVQILFNVTFDTQNSCFYTYTYKDGVSDKQSITNNFFSDPAIYILKLVSTKSISLNDTQVPLTQWFVFQLTAKSQTFYMGTTEQEDVSDLDSTTIISTGTFTSKNVAVGYLHKPSVFDAVTTLKVTHKTYGKTIIQSYQITQNQPKVFTENGFYEVELLNSKGISSAKGSFYIDKQEITDYSIYNVKKNENLKFVKSSSFNFLTNNSIALSFGNKSSGATVSCEYRFYPMNAISGDYLDVFNQNQDLEYFYKSWDENNYAIPVLYQINYKQDAISILYTQSNNLSNISTTSVLTDAGLYVFRLFDDAGNEKYFSACIDISTPVVLQERTDGHFEKISDINTVSENTTLYFGKYKIVEMLNFNTASEDVWVKSILNNNENLFKRYAYSSVYKNYLRVPINKTLYYSIGGQNPISYTLSEENNYSFIVNAMVDGIANENQYEFYIRDVSNTNTGINTEQTYLKYHSSVYNIRVSFDASKLAIYYNKDDSKNSLFMNSYYSENDLKTIKNQYYNPTNKKTFSTDENIYISFVVKPYENVIEVEDVVLEYYPFVYDKTNKTYDYATSPNKTFNIYKYDYVANLVTSDLTVTDGEIKTYTVYSVYDYRTGSYKTMEGKYVLTRTYHNFEGSSNSVSEKNDYITRIQTFYVDKNSIITSPEMVEDVGLVSYVGGAIKARITADDFTEIYLAQNYNKDSKFDGSTENILTTNKLPVKLFIPSVKYANPTTAGFSYAGANYFDNERQQLINYYKLNATVTKYTSQSALENDENGYVVYSGNATDVSGYLSIPELKESGNYKVVISQNDPTASDFVFAFQIEYSKPNFIVLDSNNIELKSLNGLYFTNQNTFTVNWTDPDNEYMAKIDYTNLAYTITYKDNTSVLRNAVVSDYNANEKNHSYTIDLSDENNLENITEITISAEYQGEEADFPVGYFRATRKVVIDKIAPTENITGLLNKTGLSGFESSIRDTSNSIYNISTKQGDFKYFAFAVDYSELDRVIRKNTAIGTEGYDIWYRHMPNKYNESYYQETNPTEFVSSGYTSYNDQTYRDLLTTGFNTYYEFIESDLAGNLTIYTIYLTHNEKLEDDTTFITWEAELLEESQKITKSTIKTDVELYSKVNFNLDSITFHKNNSNNGYPWYYIELNGDIYYHTPYLENNTLSDGNFTYNLEHLTKLQVSNNMQAFTIGNIPYYHQINLKVGVLNQDKVLSYSHFGQSSIYKDENTGEYVFFDLEGNEILRAKEGIIIEIPNNKGDTASVFASSLTIKEPRNSEDNIIYTLNTDLSSIESIDHIEQSNAIGVMAYTSANKTYAVFYVKNPASNQYYLYTITDNFGENYNVIVIFGEEIADESWKSSVQIKKILNNNINYYYSTDTMYFNFNSVKNYIEFKINNATYSTKDADDMTLLKANNNGLGVKVSQINNSAIYRVEILAPDMTQNTNGQFGGQRVVQVDVKINLTNTEDYTTTYIAEIYNAIPEINLFDKNNNKINAIFTDHSMIVGYPVTVKFADTSSNKYPNIVYLLNNDTKEKIKIQSGYVINQAGYYSIIIAYDINSIFAEDVYSTYKDFNVYDSAVDFYEVYIEHLGEKVTIEETGYTYSFRDVTNSNNETVVYSHYIVNTLFNIACNEAQKITYTQYTQTINTGNIKTYIYKIYNTNATADNTNINYFEKLIAVSVVPQTNILINKLTNENAQNDVLYDSGNDNQIYSRKFTLQNGDTSNGVLKLSWNSYYGIKENLITAKVYDETGKLLNPKVETINNTSYVYLDESGYYNLTFTDLAGNTQYFGANTKFMITFVSSAIFKINGERPVNNIIYDSAVEITIPSSTLSLYDNSAVPKITLYKNGELVNISPNNKTSYNIVASGFYKVKFSANVAGKQLREEEYYFTIINPNETRWAYEFQEYGSYYIEKVVRNGYDITSKLTKKSIGKIVNINGTDYLKNLLISIYDEQTGAGEYTLTVCTNDINNARFTFSFWIHNAKPPIFVSVPEGTETYDPIEVNFNVFNLYEEVKECRIVITGRKDMIINQQYLDTLTESQGIVSIKLTEKNTYYIQVYSEGGNLLYSYRVDKKEPLNTISIVLIVVGSLLVAGLIIMFIILRKRVKIR